MKPKRALLIAIATAVVLAAIYGAHLVVESSPLVQSRETVATAPVLETPVGTRNTVSTEPIEADTEPTPRQSVPGRSLSGRVVDKLSSLPVRRFSFVVWRQESGGAGERRAKITETSVDDANGAFFAALDRVGTYRLRIYSSRHLTETIDDLVIADTRGVADLEIRLDPGLSVTGGVVDDVSGQAIAGAIVSTAHRSSGLLRRLFAGETDRYLHDVTDSKGEFTLSGLSADSQKISAIHEAYAEGWAQVIPAQGISGQAISVPGNRIEIRLKRGVCVWGTAYDDTGTAKQGVWISVHGDELPLTRPLVTAADGTYRTPPLRPGTVELLAQRPGGSDKQTFAFATEWQVAEIRDQDVRVDFGIATNTATWRGTLFGYDGKPQSGGSVSIYFRPNSWVGHKSLLSHSRNTNCDEQGVFELSKIPLGNYTYMLRLADGSRGPGQLPIRFDSSGLLERDIHLDVSETGEALGEIRGIVIDSATGMPLVPEKRSYVSAMLRTPTIRSFVADIGKSGGFHFKSLPAATYSLQTGIRGRPPALEKGVVLEAGETIEDLRLVVEVGGEVRLRLEGFGHPMPPTFEYSLQNDAGSPWFRAGTESVAENGTWEITRTLEQGSFTANITFEKIGVARCPFQIRAGQRTDVIIRPTDLNPFGSPLRVVGSLCRPNGAQVAATRLGFYANDVPGVEAEAKFLQVSTDARGMFSLDGFLPGKWRASAYLEGRAQVEFPDLIIPAGASSPFPLHLVLPSGSVFGTLADKRTGLAFDKQGPKWWIRVISTEERRTVGQIQGGQTGSRFDVPGIPPGKYQLSVIARGYDKYQSAIFQHGGTGQVDLGKLQLTPCGVLELEVVDAASQAIASFAPHCNQAFIPTYRREKLGKGRCRLFDLPLDKVIITLEADGYKTQSKSIILKPGSPQKLQFILQKL